ncbi:MAG: hypothetical protein CW338_10725, partial [Clostridiales bacterium]|nr:hypothetical protein [Clostridiales bacterium]
MLVPSEADQIEIIDLHETESTHSVPFVFSVPQLVTDTFLQFGGNTTNHRQAIVTDFMKQFPIETIAEHLQKLYHGGNGMEINGRQYTAWYDESGIHISQGNRARYMNQSQVISWLDAAKRIETMMDARQFATMLEIAEAPATERKQIAQTLWYL